MDYLKHYTKLVETRSKLDRSRGNEYYELHHKVPKCFKGSNNKENLVLLTAKEHYIAHLLLCAIRPKSKKLKWALRCMCLMSNGFKIKAGRLFQYLREQHLGENNPAKQVEARLKISQKLKNKKKSIDHVAKIKQHNAKNSKRIELNGIIYSSILEAYKHTNIHRATLHKNLTGQIKSISIHSIKYI